jgi:hypothetical protein
VLGMYPPPRLARAAARASGAEMSQKITTIDNP